MSRPQPPAPPSTASSGGLQLGPSPMALDVEVRQGHGQTPPIEDSDAGGPAAGARHARGYGGGVASSCSCLGGFLVSCNRKIDSLLPVTQGDIVTIDRAQRTDLFARRVFGHHRQQGLNELMYVLCLQSGGKGVQPCLNLLELDFAPLENANLSMGC